MFINHTNHPSEFWNQDQITAASAYGEIIDIPFPVIDPHWDDEEIDKLVLQNGGIIEEKHPDMVLCQGEFIYAFRLIEYLKRRGIKVVAACSERVAREKQNEDGTVVKESVFRFVQFREY